jgi:hypothetical protein
MRKSSFAKSSYEIIAFTGVAGGEIGAGGVGGGFCGALGWSIFV